jgi:hypothetical protein
MDILIPLTETLILAIPVLVWAIGTVPTADRRWMTRIVAVALSLRLLVAILFVLFRGLRIYHDDAAAYELYGSQLAAYWHGVGPPLDLVDNYRQATAQGMPLGWLYFCGIVYYVFGRYQLMVTGVTSIFGALSVIMTYKLASQLFHRVVARRTAVLMALFPSMILWSSMALKDPAMLLLILCAFYALLRLRHGFRLSAVVLFTTALVGMWFVRYYIIYFVVFASMASLLVARRRAFFSVLARQVIGGALVLGFLTLVGLTGHLASHTEQLNLSYVSGYRAGMAISANSGFMSSVDVSTPAGALAFLPIGLAVLWFGPFPWQMRSIGALVSLPEMLIWWSMVPSIVRGTRFALRSAIGSTSPLVFFVVSVSSIYALGLGNVGAAFRMRAQVLAFFFVFAAVGHFVAVCKRRRLDPTLLLADGTPAPSPGSSS